MLTFCFWFWFNLLLNFCFSYFFVPITRSIDRKKIIFSYHFFDVTHWITSGYKSTSHLFSRVHATLHPALLVRPSVRWSVGPSVGPSVRRSVRHTLLFVILSHLKSIIGKKVGVSLRLFDIFERNMVLFSYAEVEHLYRANVTYNEIDGVSKFDNSVSFGTKQNALQQIFFALWFFKDLFTKNSKLIFFFNFL